MIPWMVSWAADVVVKYHARSNGRTAYEDMTTHRVKHMVAGFGERVQFMVAKGVIQNKYDGEWCDGYSMGVVMRSSEYLVAQGDQIYKCPTMRRWIDGDAYTIECLTDIRTDFNEYIRRGATTTRTEVIRGEGKVSVEVPKTVEKKFQPRGLKIREEDLGKFGYTAGCAGCEWYGSKIGIHRGHTKDCRARIEGGCRKQGSQEWR